MDARPSAAFTAQPPRCSVVGRGRLGTVIARTLRAAGLTVSGPHGRGYDGTDSDVVLLCVPDAAIAQAAALIVPGPLVGHCSGATTLDVLAPHPGFSLHPLMTVVGADTDLTDVPCAVAGNTPAAEQTAQALADALGMQPFTLNDADRAAYHAAASVAANYLLSVEDLAERLLHTADLDRRILAPLVQAAVAGWQERGAGAALTGPVARGDAVTVAGQRDAVVQRLSSDDLALFNALTDATARLAARETSTVAGVAA